MPSVFATADWLSLDPPTITKILHPVDAGNPAKLIGLVGLPMSYSALPTRSTNLETRPGSGSCRGPETRFHAVPDHVFQVASEMGFSTQSLKAVRSQRGEDNEVAPRHRCIPLAPF